MSDLAPAVSVCIKVLELLGDEPCPLGISDISKKTGINKNMIFRTLNTLELDGWVIADISGRYSLTLRPFRTASRAVNKTSLVSTALPIITELWEKFGESTYLGIFHGDSVMYLSHLDSRQSVKVAGEVGGTYPLYCTAPGKVLLAHATDSFISEYLTHERTKLTENTITNKADLLNELALIRQNGYALDREEYSRGIVCLAAPVFDYTGNVAGVIGCSFSTVYFGFDSVFNRFGTDILESAKKISLLMGYTAE